MKYPHRRREDRRKTTLRAPETKHAINPRVVNLRPASCVFFDRQLLPLTADMKQFQNVVEDRIQRQFGQRTTTANHKMWADKFLKRFFAQIRWNPLPLLALRHFEAQSNWILIDSASNAEQPRQQTIPDKLPHRRKPAMSSKYLCKSFPARRVDADSTPLVRQGELSSGFEQQAVRLRGGCPMQRTAHPARATPLENFCTSTYKVRVCPPSTSTIEP